MDAQVRAALPASPEDEERFVGVARIDVRSLCVGSAVDVRQLRRAPSFSGSPLTVWAGEGGCAIVFRYGAVVLFGVRREEEVGVLREIAPMVTAPLAEPLVEETTLVRIDRDAAAGEGIDGDRIVVEDFALPRLQVVAEVLARSVVLDRFEAKAEGAFESLQPVAAALRMGRVSRAHGRLVTRHLGDVLVDRQEMIGRVEVLEKPDLLWDNPPFERLHAKLMDEFEIADRHERLEEKFAIISRTAETVIELIHSRSSLRVEWYIVILIVVEIVLTLYELFWRGH